MQKSSFGKGHPIGDKRSRALLWNMPSEENFVVRRRKRTELVDDGEKNVFP